MLKKRMFFSAVLSLFVSTSLCADIDYYPKEDHVAEYLKRMPWHQYKSYKVNDLGQFWVDNAKDCVKDTIKSGKKWEKYILDVLKKHVKKGDNVIDIGGHMGTITMALSNLVGENGHVYTFEGERQFFRELYHNLALNNKQNVTAHLCWLSDEIKEVNATWYYPHSYSPVWSKAKDTPYSLHVRTLDSFGLKNIAVLKMDVECMEDQILDGARETIMTSRPIMIIEIMGGFGNSKAPEVAKRIRHTISKLEAMNYSVKKIHIDDYLAIPNEKR